MAIASHTTPIPAPCKTHAVFRLLSDATFPKSSSQHELSVKHVVSHQLLGPKTTVQRCTFAAAPTRITARCDTAGGWEVDEANNRDAMNHQAARKWRENVRSAQVPSHLQWSNTSLPWYYVHRICKTPQQENCTQLYKSMHPSVTHAGSQVAKRQIACRTCTLTSTPQNHRLDNWPTNPTQPVHSTRHTAGCKLKPQHIRGQVAFMQQATALAHIPNTDVHISSITLPAAQQPI